MGINQISAADMTSVLWFSVPILPTFVAAITGNHDLNTHNRNFKRGYKI